AAGLPSFVGCMVVSSEASALMQVHRHGVTVMKRRKPARAGAFHAQPRLENEAALQGKERRPHARFLFAASDSDLASPSRSIGGEYDAPAIHKNDHARGCRHPAFVVCARAPR